MKQLAWASAVFVGVAVVVTVGVVLYSSRDAPTLPTSDPVGPLQRHQTPTQHAIRSVTMAVTVRGIADAIPVYRLDMDNPRYVLAGHAQPQGVLVRVHATFTNVSDSDLALDESEDFTLVGEDGELYRVSTPATVRPRWARYRKTPIAEMRLRPWVPYDALLYFNLPESVSRGKLRLRFRDNPAASFRILGSN